jgi:hypothetical protein
MASARPWCLVYCSGWLTRARASLFGLLPGLAAGVLVQLIAAAPRTVMRSRGQVQQPDRDQGSQRFAPEAVAVPETFRPPFDLLSDMLLVVALCPTSPLARSFPSVPFLSCLGRTPLLAWFSRVKQGWYDDPSGARRCDGGLDVVLYYELTVIALLRQRAVFVPGIYATEERTIRVSRYYYGMPKVPTQMGLRVAGRSFVSWVVDRSCESRVEAWLLGRGSLVAALLSHLWPREIWPAGFPSGGSVRATIQATPRARLALVRGRLALNAPWLPAVAPLLPIGLYLPDLRMRLP